jgi:hypothetical protein
MAGTFEKNEAAQGCKGAQFTPGRQQSGHASFLLQIPRPNIHMYGFSTFCDE